jgi:hypothetical protein
MFSLTKEELFKRAKLLFNGKETDKLINLVELAYDSGRHDGFYECIEQIKKAKNKKNKKIKINKRNSKFLCHIKDFYIGINSYKIFKKAWKTLFKKIYKLKKK